MAVGRQWVHGAWTLALAAILVPARSSAAAVPEHYAVDFVSTAATGAAMNGHGDVAGHRFFLAPGCEPSTCAPSSEAVVWADHSTQPLPVLLGFSTVTPRGINASRWVAGYAGDPSTTGGRAVVWQPSAAGYTVLDLGVLPGTTSSWATGIDDLGRVVGYSTTLGFPATGAAFVWTDTTGMVNLAPLGFPNEPPLAISPGGTVATPGFWYRLDDPTSVTALTPPPPGFSGPGNYPASINDAGDQVRFQISTTTGFFPYLFRYHHTGWWQQIWFLPAGHLAPYGVGSIDAAGTVTATVGGVGLVAAGPDGLAGLLADRLSPAYSSDVITGGPINEAGQVLARVMIGRAPRLVRLQAAEPCATGCTRVADIRMAGRFVHDPQNPGQCTDSASNRVTAAPTVTDEAGQPLRGAVVTARFLDDYYLDEPATATTGRNGTVAFLHRGPACVGAIAILIEDVTAASRTLDRTVGVLTAFVVPVP